MFTYASESAPVPPNPACPRVPTHRGRRRAGGGGRSLRPDRFQAAHRQRGKGRQVGGMGQTVEFSDTRPWRLPSPRACRCRGGIRRRRVPPARSPSMAGGPHPAAHHAAAGVRQSAATRGRRYGAVEEALDDRQSVVTTDLLGAFDARPRCRQGMHVASGVLHDRVPRLRAQRLFDHGGSASAAPAGLPRRLLHGDGQR
jgi:hypothetical protein